MLVAFIVCGLLLAAPGASFVLNLDATLAATLNTTAVEIFFDQQFSPDALKDHKLGSVFVSIASGSGPPIWEKGYGHVGLANNSGAPTSRTVYNMGDLSTLFAAGTIMRAVSDGFNLTQPIDQYYKDAEFRAGIHSIIVGNYTAFQGFPFYSLGVNKLSPLPLLLHTAGLDGSGTRGRFIDLSKRRKLDNYLTTFGPRRVRYENMIASFNPHGISYVALAVGAFLKKSKAHFSIFKDDDKDALYDAYFQRFIHKPLNLTATYLMLTDEIFKLPTLHNYYHIPTKDEDNYVDNLNNIYNSSTLYAVQYYPSADMYSSAADVLTFVQMLCSEGKTAGGTTVISPEAIDLMKNTFFNPFAKLKFQNNITLSIGSGIGFQQGRYGDIPFLESCSYGSFQVWKHRVRIFPKQNLILLFLCFGVESVAQNYLDSVQLKFVEKFLLNRTSCDGFMQDGLCYYDYAKISSTYSWGNSDNASLLAQYEGPFVSEQYAHTTWEKVMIYEYMSTSKSRFVLLRVHPDPTKRLLINVKNGDCLYQIEPNLFYRGSNVSIEKGCGWKYPLHTDNLVTFLPDKNGEWTYLLFGKLGALMPFEKSFLEFRLKWDIAFIVYIALFGSLFVITGFLSLFLFKFLSFKNCCQRGRGFGGKELFAADTFIATILALASHLLQSLCNCLALLGLRFYVKKGFLILDEEYIIPVLLTSLSLLGVVFWILQVSTTVYLWTTQTYRTHHSAREMTALPDPNGTRCCRCRRVVPLLFKMLLTLSCIAELFFMTTLMNWNWLGPSHVI